MLSAIIVAGGSSRRMGFDKTFASLGGKPIIAHSIGAFEATASVDEIIVVGRAERIAELEQLVRQENFRKIRAVIAGGVHRQDSVNAGLQKASGQFVAVHDAARPLVTPELIERVFTEARRHDAAAAANPVSDTLKRADGEHRVVASVAREQLFAMQTPQIFSRAVLVEAYAAVFAAKAEITDEVSALELLGRPVILVPHQEPNFKITYPADLALAEAHLARDASAGG